jgi:hypothetical protein
MTDRKHEPLDAADGAALPDGSRRRVVAVRVRGPALPSPQLAALSCQMSFERVSLSLRARIFHFKSSNVTRWHKPAVAPKGFGMAMFLVGWDGTNRPPRIEFSWNHNQTAYYIPCAKNISRSASSHADFIGSPSGYSLAADVSDANGTSSAYTKPLGSYVNRTSPLSCLPSVSISRVPKLRFSGA